MELKRVPLNPQTVRLVSGEFAFYGDELDINLILKKNEAYGDSWQAEGPFVAAGRMKDKIVRVETLLDQHDNLLVSQHTIAEGFQDILEMMQYGKMLMLYWAFNNLGIPSDAPHPVRELYRSLVDELEDVDAPDATGE